jgi:hypothetical protein
MTDALSASPAHASGVTEESQRAAPNGHTTMSRSGRWNPLEYRMVMALSAADIGEPISDQAAAICAEIADQYCAERHLSPAAPVLAREPLDLLRPETLTEWEEEPG